MSGITHMGNSLEEYLEDNISWLGRVEEDGSKIKSKDGALKSNLTEMKPFPYVEAKDGAWNQVRPHKYIPVIGYNNDEDIFFIMPPEDIIEKAISRKGQHTINSMECVNLGKPTSTNWGKDYAVDEAGIEETLLEVYRISHSDSNKEVKEFAASCRKNIEILIEEQQETWRRLNDTK